MVQIWSRYPRNFETTKPSKTTVWIWGDAASSSTNLDEKPPKFKKRATLDQTFKKKVLRNARAPQITVRPKMFPGNAMYGQQPTYSSGKFNE